MLRATPFRHSRVLKTAPAFPAIPPSMAVLGGNPCLDGTKMDPRLREDDELVCILPGAITASVGLATC
jgi:hypothetical protein